MVHTIAFSFPSPCWPRREPERRRLPAVESYTKMFSRRRPGTPKRPSGVGEDLPITCLLNVTSGPWGCRETSRDHVAGTLLYLRLLRIPDRCFALGAAARTDHPQ